MSGTHDNPTGGYPSVAISNAVVRVLSEYTGRGPTKARTYINEDLVSVVLHDTLTKGERTLLADGEVALVLANRKAFQNTMRTAMVTAVEGLTDRHVIAFLSDNHIDPDVAIESFVLAPRGGGARPDAEVATQAEA